MGKKLVAYFSASGVTSKVAAKLASAAGADLFEIMPEIPYTSADLNYMNRNSRSSKEMNDTSSRPAIASKVENMADYDVVFIGFPVWWYREPSIIDTFMESYDFAGKTILPLCSNEGSGMGHSESDLRRMMPCADIKSGLPITGSRAASASGAVKRWLSSNGII